MLTGRDLNNFRSRLLEWFRKFQRDLPWRRSNDPYTIWISEIMLQQTRVAAVIPYYQRFLARFPDVYALAEAPEEDVLRVWSGLGYYSRARNLRKAAQQIVARHGGQFPRDEEAILALPGIGRYTLAAISSIAFGAEKAVLDGNVARVLSRLGAIRGGLGESRARQSLQTTAAALLDPSSPGDWNQAMMELGAMVCTPCAPRCLLCPVAKFCRAKSMGDPEAYPEKRKKREAARVVLAAAVFSTPHGVTLLMRPAPGRTKLPPVVDDVAILASRMWHFPTIVIRKDPRAELERYIGKSLRARNVLLQVEPLSRVRHAVTYRDLTVFPFRVQVARIPHMRGTKSIRLRDFSKLPVSNLTRKIARAALSEQPEAPARPPTRAS